MSFARSSVATIFFLVALPVFASAQSMEWLAEHPGVTPPIPVTPTPAPILVNTNDGLETKIRAYFNDVPLMAEIARCESRFRQFADSGNPLDGGAGGMIGLFQINSSVHANYAKSIGMDIYSVEGNLAYARRLYEKEGTDPWLSSFDCWHNAATTNSGPVTLLHDLLLGSISPEVKALQVMLNGSGFTLTTDGPGSPGQETDKFGSLTRAAVRKYQCQKMQICSGDEHSTGFGLVDLRTRESLTGSAGSSNSSNTASTDGNSTEIARLTALIAQLSAQLNELRQKSTLASAS